MNKGTIYLSGGMEKAVENGAQWRKVCSLALDHMGYTPLDIAALDLEYIKKHGPVYLDKDPANYLQYKSNIRRQFIYTDLRLITDLSDAVIAFYDQSFKDGAGSFAECQCSYDNDKPLFVVSAFEHVPSWLKSLSTKVFYSFEELYLYLHNLPDGILKGDRYGNHSSLNHYLCSLCGEVFEKKKHHFVSKVSPLYCKSCVDVVMKTREEHADRYQFIAEYLEANKDTK
jgi:hypothetical protein